jgi:hypothetical protein
MRRSECGGILPLFLISLLMLLGVAALAIDAGHGFVNKARLQNALDAAALGGAKVFDTTGNATAAEAEARAVFNATAATPGNEELEAALDDATVAVTFSANLVPFTPVASGSYVRVSVQGVGISNGFASAVGIGRFNLAGTAVAGPSPKLDQMCDVAPMMACGDPGSPPAAGGTSFYGYTVGSVQMLKISANTASTVGPGNFQLINLSGAQGGADIRTAMAGSMDACLSEGESTTVNTAPGNTVGPATQGINTRFGIYKGPVSPARYPPDWVTTHDQYTLTEYQNHVQPSFNLDSYLAATSQAAINPPTTGAPGRRILRIPIGNCTGTATGSSQVQLLGVGCFFLISPAQQQGTQAQIFGQFKEGCGGSGTPGPNPGAGFGPHVIQLYHDPGSTES